MTAKNGTDTDARSLVTTRDMIVSLLTRLYGSGVYTWRDIALLEAFRPIPPGTLCAIAEGGDIPKKWYKRLGLAEVETAPAPVCQKCGAVHVTKRCTQNRKPRTRWADYSRRELRWALDNREEMQ